MNTSKGLTNFNDLAQYHIVTKLGAGGLADSFRAYDTIEEKDVMIKVIRSEQIWSKIVEKREQILSCPSFRMPKIFNILTIDGYNCVVEEFIDGECLSNVISANMLKFNDFFLIVKDIISALIKLHECNLVYGDVNPCNIIVKHDITETYLCDIYSAFLYKSGVIWGTLSYAAPEQILENSLSIYSDTYSMGILMYYILQNHIPFHMSKEGILDKVNGNINLSLSNVSDVSFKEELQALIEKMTCSEKTNRPKLDAVLRKIEVLQTKAKNSDELTRILHNDHQHDFLSDSSPKDDRTFLDSVMFNSAMIGNGSVPYYTASDFGDSKLSGADEAIEQIKKNLNQNKLFSSKGNAHESNYRKQLVEEYAQLNKQASISFWLWVISFILGFGIIVIVVIMTILGHYFEALTTVVLEALVYFVQRLFKIREDSYRELNNGKLKHLESGDYYDYIMEILDTTRDEFREEKIDTLIKSIQKQIE